MATPVGLTQRLSGLLLAGNGALRALAGASVGAGALTANREAATVADTTVAIDRLEALEIGGVVATEIALNDPLVIGDHVEDLVELLFRKVLSAHVGIDADFFNDQVSTLRTDAVDVTEGERDFLLRLRAEISTQLRCQQIL